MDLCNPHRVRRRFGLGHEGGTLYVGLQDCIHKRGLAAWDFLIHTTQAHIGAQGYGPVIGADLAFDQAEECRFTRAVSTHKAHFLALIDGEGGLLEEGTAFNPVSEVIDMEHEKGLVSKIQSMDSR
jgi:hypothetical protein